jgi:hypothetical protein
MSDSTEKRVLSINPDLFKVSKNNSTRKNKPPSEKPAKIKIRDPMKTHAGNSRTLKRNLLNYIRKQQDLKSKTMFQDKEHSGGHAARRVAAQPTDEILDKDENSHFKESLDFLTNLTNEKERREKMEKTHNQTLKRHESMDKFESNLYNLPHTNTVENVHLTFPPDIKVGIQPETGPAIPWKHYPPPTHGCLKNGSLPTYRTWKNQTQKNYGTAPNVSVPAPSVPAIYAPPPVPLAQKTPEDIKNERMQMKLQEIQQRIAAMKNRVLVNETQPVENAEKSDRDAVKTAQSHQMPALLGKKVAGFVNKQRKTIRRTYQVGKSKRAPKVSVLISNKTIRKNVLTKTHLLHQVPIHDVKKYLVKKGFIRVGTPAPTDVLRKMYESALLMCGEIENHNPDNLLYNFMHAEHDLGNK